MDFLGIPKEYFTGVVLFASAVMATVGWSVTNRTQRLVDRRKHTYEVFQKYKDDILDDVNTVSRLVRTDNMPQFEQQDRESDVKAIEKLLGQYEFLSASILRGDIDENFMISCEFTRLISLYWKCLAYIREARTTKQQPTMFRNLEIVATRWTKNYNTELLRLEIWPPFRLIEFVRARPYIPRPPRSSPLMPGSP